MIVGHIGGGAVGAGYEIEKSLRLRAAASAYLSRTFGIPSGSTMWTYSCWVKRGNLATRTVLLSGFSDANNRGYLEINDSGVLRYDDFYSSAQRSLKVSNAIFRDPSAWYHVLFVCDTGNVTAALRQRAYVNGIEITSWSSSTDYHISTAPSINWHLGNRAHRVGDIWSNTANLDGYLSEIHFIDGQALTPSSFGEFNADGVWVPKKYAGTYGTNGFYLPFNDGTNLTELCRDRSGNGNDWTASGISLTAGATYDWMDDTPTNNFAVLNRLQTQGYSNLGFSNGNLTASNTSTGGAAYLSSLYPVSGSYYFEATATTVTGNFFAVWAHGKGYYSNGTRDGTVAFGAAYTSGDVIGVAFNMTTNEITFFKNGVSQGVQTGTGADAGLVFFSITNSGDTWNVNFGQRPFAYNPPTGFKALCTKNRPSVTITDPRQHHTVITVTKSGDTNFTLPWNATDFDTLFWIKRRDASGDWYQIDGLRGYDKILKSNSTAAETTDANVLGVSGTTCTLKSTLPNGTYVIYAWKAGRVAERQTNTSGTITSTVSRNVTAGFSIVTYTGTGANATVGHGLGNVPKMQIVKARVDSFEWKVWHTALSSGNQLILNNTAGQALDSSVFTATTPTSTVVSIGSNVATNQSTRQYVAYCHAEIPGYSKFGSYTGNGSTDGPFVWGDVSVMDVLVKRSDSFGDWVVWDAARSPDNVANEYVYPHLPNTEATSGADVDILSSGFKMRQTTYNANGGTYIYAAYARHPFGAENVSPAPAR